MTRRYNPDGTLLLTALAGRIDALERTTTEAGKDVAAIGRSLADVTAQLRRLSDLGHSPAGRSGDDGSDEVADQQPDWLTVTDAETACEWLTFATTFADVILVPHGHAFTMPCWTLHPTVVADLLALACERQAAYTGPTPTPVSEWLTRWLPAGLDRIGREMAECNVERGHRADGRTYDVTGFDPSSAAVWWATERRVPAVIAFQLSPL